jgi:putative FmdB family regulatory protein
MAVYEYRCSCGMTLDKVTKDYNPSDTMKCPKCGKRAKRVVSLTNFELKGDGWSKQYNDVKSCKPKGA